MATVSRSDSKHMYSWRCASHISPKNSKWLQQNLTDMDVKYELMKRNLELGDGSFGEKAEMYVKRCPELTKLVEDFYRTYRALAERYDHATGVIRQAHKTMAEAFPSQVPYLDSDEGSLGLSSDPDESHKGAVGLSPSTSHSVDRNGTFGSKDNTEKEVAALKEALARITEEKEAAAHQYEQCVERISSD